MTVPLLWVAKRMRRKCLRAINRRTGPGTLRRQLAQAEVKRVVIGAARKFDAGWIPTEQEVLDLLKPAVWAQYFPPDSIDAMLAEHVWEHMTLADGFTAARTCYTYLKPGGYLRLAVPDGNHPSEEYLSWNRIGGACPGQKENDHKVLYTYTSFTELLTCAGFQVTLYEYFNEAKEFCFKPFDPALGTIRRSSRFDPLNRGGKLISTSIVVDAVKPVTLPSITGADKEPLRALSAV